MPTAIRILIADDHLLFRQGLKSLLKSESDVVIVGETDRAEGLVSVLDRTPCDVLLLDSVVGGNVWMPPSLQNQLAARLRDPTASLLSPREEEVVRYVATGMRNAEVARKLSISEQTVKVHLNAIFRKLGLRDRVQLVLYASQAGLTGGGRRF